MRILPGIGCGLLIVSMLGCGDGGSDGGGGPASGTGSGQPKQAESHLRMIEALADVEAREPDENVYLGDRVYRALIRQMSDESFGVSKFVRVNRRMSLSIEALRLGKEQEAIDFLMEAHALKPSVQIAFLLGMSHMRLAETQNCCLQPVRESCIMPFAPEAVHPDTYGAEQAIKWFTVVLESPGVDANMRLGAVWLINVAYMALGRYPDDVPEAFLIPEKAFESDIPFPRFENVASALGVDSFNLSGGAVVDDFDNDDDLDILTTTWNVGGPMHYFRNNSDGSFTDVTDTTNLEGITGGLNMMPADYDNDGDLDVLIMRGAWLGKQGKHPNSLLQNDGNAVFTDVAFDAGLCEEHFATHMAGWADFDNDGDVDLYVANEFDADQLFRNNGDGTFTDITEEAGVGNEYYPKGVTWGDIDGDHLPDLCVSNYRSENRLYHNNGDGTFTDIAMMAGVDGPKESFPAWFWDMNNDGNLDLFIASYNGNASFVAGYHLGQRTGYELPGLFRGDGQGRFTQMAGPAGLTAPIYPMGANFGDLNGDGFLDFYLGTGDPSYASIVPNQMYVNDGGERFLDVTMAGGFGHLQKGHGIALADLDHDGDVDVFEQMGGAYPGDRFYDALYENPGFEGHHALTVKLVGVKTNRSAIGARIHLVVRDADGASRSIYRHVNSGGSFGANPMRQTIGLGKATGIERMDVLWPTTGETQTFEDVAMDQFIRITEGSDAIERIEVKVFKLGGSGE